MRTKRTITEGKPRESGPHGVTLDMIAIKRSGDVEWAPDPDRDRSLRGKARRLARKAARR